jgi:hypothetical protein
MVYNGAKNAGGTRNSQYTTYWTSVPEATNIFSPLTHETDGWIAPTGSVPDSFGWISDLYYPWIYSASQDILSNDHYQGNGAGWIYIYADGASLSGGFYVYRYAAGTWGWTNYYWSGWVYDYGYSSWVDITP